MMGFEVAKAIGQNYIVAVTIASEVGPQGTQPERRAVASVIHNRATRDNITFLKVVLAPKQFSGVGHDYWIRYLAGTSLEATVRQCYADWEWVVENGPVFPETVRWYYSPISMEPPFSEPYWARRLTYYPTPDIAPDRFKFYGDPEGTRLHSDTREWDHD